MADKYDIAPWNNESESLIVSINGRYRLNEDYAALEKERDELLRQNAALTGARDGAVCEIERLKGCYQRCMESCSALQDAQAGYINTIAGAYNEIERLKGERDELKSLLSDSSQIMEQQADLIDRQEKTSDDLLNSATQATEIAARAVEKMGEGWKTNSYEAQFMRHWCKDEAAKIRNGDIEL